MVIWSRLSVVFQRHTSLTCGTSSQNNIDVIQLQNKKASDPHPASRNQSRLAGLASPGHLCNSRNDNHRQLGCVLRSIDSEATANSRSASSNAWRSSSVILGIDEEARSCVMANSAHRGRDASFPWHGLRLRYNQVKHAAYCLRGHFNINGALVESEAQRFGDKADRQNYFGGGCYRYTFCSRHPAPAGFAIPRASAY